MSASHIRRIGNSEKLAEKANLRSAPDYTPARDDERWPGWCVCALFYWAVWIAVWAIAHYSRGLALGVGAAFVIVPGIYLLARVRIERIALLLHPDRWYRG